MPPANSKTAKTPVPLRSGGGTEQSGFYCAVKQRLYDAASPFQQIQVVETEDWGRVMLLDGEIMTTDWDGFVYPEMIVHPALMAHPAPREVAIIGGGDGGAVTEATRYADLATVHLCEIDREVVAAAKQFFPQLAQGFADPRCRCVYEDGRAWIAAQPDRFDVLVVDGTDPIGPGKGLFEAAFYQAAKRALKPGGIFVQQVESPFYSLGMKSLSFELRLEDIVARARQVFPQVHLYTATIPTYLGSYWAFLYAGDQDASTEPRMERWQHIAGQTRYYSPDIHRAAFVLPPFVAEMLGRTP